MIETIVSFILMIFKVLCPFIILTLVWIITKIIYNYKVYGKIEFQIFQKNKKIDKVKLVASLISKIEGKRKIIIEQNKLIIIDRSGVYVCLVKEYDGIITGNRKNETLKNRKNVKLEVDIPNPFVELDEFAQLLKIENKKILIVNNTVNINVEGTSKNDIIMIKNLYYTLRKLFENQIYDENKINQIYKSLCKI